MIKLNKNTGEIVWSKQLGSEFEAELGVSRSDAEDTFFSIAHDATSVYCAGETSGNLGETSAGSSDVFVVKFSKVDGRIIWVKQIGQTTLDGLYGIGNGFGINRDKANSVDIHRGDIYIGGSTSSNFSEALGGGTGEDGFILKISEDVTDPTNPIPELVWIKQLGDSSLGVASEGIDNVYSVYVDDSGVYLGGTTTGNLGENVGGGIDPFMAKVIESGSASSLTLTIDWVKQLGAENSLVEKSYDKNGFCNSIKVDESFVYCAGYTLNSYNGENAGLDDIFIWGELK